MSAYFYILVHIYAGVCDKRWTQVMFFYWSSTYSFETGIFAWARISWLQNWPGICGSTLLQTLTVTMCSFCMGAGAKYFYYWVIFIAVFFSNMLIFNNLRITNFTHKHTKNILNKLVIWIENCDFFFRTIAFFYDHQKPDHTNPLMENP